MCCCQNKYIMKRVLYYCGVVLLISTLFLYSCQKTTDPTPIGNTTVAEDKAYISTKYNNTIDCIEGVRDGDFSQALISFLSISNNVVGNEDWINDMSSALDTAMAFPELDPNNSKFNFAAYRGIYEWNRITKKFTKSTSTAGIFINFPSEPSVTTNNINIKFTTYTDALYQANAEDVYLPTSVKATLSKNNVELMNVDATGIFSSGNFPAPINVNFNLTLKPHNYKINVTRLSSTEFTVRTEIGGDCGSVVEGKVVFLNDDYNNLDLEEDLSKVEGTYTKGDLSIKLNWDARAYYVISNPTTENLNNSIVCTVNMSGNKIADLKFKDVNGSRKVYIYYKDGTSEDTAVFNDPFTSQLKEIFRPYFGNEVDTWF